MELKSEFQPPAPPNLTFNGLENEDLVLARSVCDYLSGMRTAAQHLAEAVALFDFSRENADKGRLFSSWSLMGAREGAVQIRNFGQFLRKVRGLAGRVPQWAGKFDAAAIKDAVASFEKQFPSADKLRHSVAHPEFFGDPSKPTRAIVTDLPGPGLKVTGSANLAISSTLFNNTFHGTFEGQMLTYEVDGATVSAIIAITRQTFSAFDQLDWTLKLTRPAPPPAS